jgi:hypothetical protein
MHREESSRLRQQLHEHSELLDVTRQQYEADKAAHQRELERQCALIARLHTRKVRQDAVVDAVLAALAFTAVNTTLIDGPIQLVLMLVPRRRLREWLRQALKGVTGVALVRYMRVWAQAVGWHQSIGSVVPYARELFAATKELVCAAPAFVGGGKRDAVEPHDAVGDVDSEDDPLAVGEDIV